MNMLQQQDYASTRPWIDLDSPDVRAHLARVSDDAGFDLEQKLVEWHDRGVVTFEKAVDVQLVDALLSDVEYLRRHSKDFELMAEYRGVQKPISDFTDDELDSSGVKFNSIHSISNAACKLSLTKDVMTFLRYVFDAPPCVLQSLTFYRGSQQPAHIDYPYVRCQTRIAELAASWIPLEDIHADSGPLAYYPGSHDPRVTGFFDWGNGSIVMEPDSRRTPSEFSQYLRDRIDQTRVAPAIFLPKRGDVLVWHGNMVHEGTPIKDHARTRKSYVTHFTGLNAYPSAHKRPDGRGIEANGGFAFEYPWLPLDRRMLPSGQQG